MIKNYNSNRIKLDLPEYGRNVLQMIDMLKQSENKEERNQRAKVIIDVMGNINPSLRDSADYKHKLWGHLFLIAGFDLDIDCPYEIPTEDAFELVPDRISYPRQYFSHKQYGNNIRQVIQVLSKIEDVKLRDDAMADIAKFMKFKSYEYNMEYPSDEVILNDIRKFTDNEIHINSDMLNSTRISFNRNNNSRVNKKSRPSSTTNTRSYSNSNNKNVNIKRKPTR